MNWFKKLFTGSKPDVPVREQTGDMRDTPVDNPFDVREDGSIREGDPAWAAIQEMFNTGKPMMGNQRDDGTWDVEFIGDDDTSK